MGLNPIVRVSHFDEDSVSISQEPEKYVMEIAKGKLNVVVQSLTDNREPFDVIIACDTVIEYEGKIIGKPKNAEEAIATLKMLQGKTHNVFSGVVIRTGDGMQKVFAEKTTVRFGNVPDRIIEQYVATGEPLSKAGSYGIQDIGTIFVEGITGCFNNVVGLPIHRVHQTLIELDIL